jgi:DNA-binding MarR family transcriptional regulator
VKTRILRGIGLNVIHRPRELQQAAGTAEHHVVHELYALEKQGLVVYHLKRNIHSPGRNLTKIRLTPKGIELWRQMR